MVVNNIFSSKNSEIVVLRIMYKNIGKNKWFLTVWKIDLKFIIILSIIKISYDDD